mmetsp:Transcript_14069/g.30022  ORF Transcript_14069/g.30022 Transcript_14069/m.30022 type:complete len:414 (+) Transcript_14069:195-1436(+)
MTNKTMHSLQLQRAIYSSQNRHQFHPLPKATVLQSSVEETSRKRSVFVYTEHSAVPKDVVSVEFCPSVKGVPADAFRACYKLRHLVLNEGLEKIEEGAFCYCPTLESIMVPSTVTEIGKNAFYGCSALRYVVLKEGLQKIEELAFDNCKSLESITIPSTVISIGKYAFYRCSALRYVALNEGLRRIGRRAFWCCNSLESITVPSTIIEISADAFSGCSSLREAVLHEGLQKIGTCAFCDCRALESIILPSTLIEIGQWAFYFCGALKNVVLNECIQKIEAHAFDECSSLESLVYPFVSMRLESISWESGRNEILNKIHETSGISMVDCKVLISGSALEGGASWAACKESLDQVLRLVAYHKLKEAATIFELALWRAKMMEQSKVNDANRESCRVEVPGPAKEAVEQFLSYSET